MSLVTSIKQLGKKLTATAAAVATAGALMVAGTGEATAANRDWLRPDATGTCEWDAVAYWVQRCDVWSQAMGRNITVQIQPAARGGNAALYLLDGARATDTANAWTVDANAPRTYVNDNITLVMPVGGRGSFYTDWVSPIDASGATYMWETFLTSELPAYLEANFGVARNNNSIAGLSMGATAAVNLGAAHPDQFRQVLSFSGYLNLSGYVSHLVLEAVLRDTAGLSVNAMYGSALSQKHVEMDPMANISRLSPSQDLYVSAASGIWGPPDMIYSVTDRINGTLLEWVALGTTLQWEGSARAAGLNVTANYPAFGMHNWLQWQYQLDLTHNRVLDVMNAH